jgi:hypothetical protein
MMMPTSLSGPALGAVVKDEGVDGSDLQSCKDAIVSCKDVIQSYEDMRWMEDYGLEYNVSISPFELQLYTTDDRLQPTAARHSRTPTLTTNSYINTKFEHAKVRNYLCSQLVLMFSFSVVILVGVQPFSV